MERILGLRRRILRWEGLRIVFNLVCATAAYVAWGLANELAVAIDEVPPIGFVASGAMREFLIVFALLNVAYCLIYAVEFALLAIGWQRGLTLVRVIVFVIGCTVGAFLALRGSAGVANEIVSREKHRIEQETRAAEIRRRLEAERAARP
jgi:hypothetical protein